MFLVAFSEGGVQTTALACVASMFMFGTQPIENSALARFSPEGWRGRIFGLKFVLAFGLGGLGNWGAGAIEDAFGLSRVFVVTAWVALAALVAALVVRAIPSGESVKET